jgi:hypothetical protein
VRFPSRGRRQEAGAAAGDAPGAGRKGRSPVVDAPGALRDDGPGDEHFAGPVHRRHRTRDPERVSGCADEQHEVAGPVQRVRHDRGDHGGNGGHRGGLACRSGSALLDAAGQFVHQLGEAVRAGRQLRHGRHR